MARRRPAGPLYCAKFWPGGTVGPAPPGETRDPGLWALIPKSGERPTSCWPPAYLPALDMSNDGSYASGFRFQGAGLASPEATARAMERAIRLHDAGKITDEGLETTLDLILNPAPGTGGVQDRPLGPDDPGARPFKDQRKTGRTDVDAMTADELEAAGACKQDEEFCAIFWPGGTVTRAGRTDAELLALGYIPRSASGDEYECWPPTGTPWWLRVLGWVVRQAQEVIDPVSDAATGIVSHVLDFATAQPPASSPVAPPATAPGDEPPPRYLWRMNAWPGGFVCDTDPPQRADLRPPVWTRGGACPF